MEGINLYVITIAGITLGGLMMTLARAVSDRELSWWARGLLLIAGLAVTYGITQLPYLGG